MSYPKYVFYTLFEAKFYQVSCTVSFTTVCTFGTCNK